MSREIFLRSAGFFDSGGEVGEGVLFIRVKLDSFTSSPYVTEVCSRP